MNFQEFTMEIENHPFAVAGVILVLIVILWKLFIAHPANNVIAPTVTPSSDSSTNPGDVTNNTFNQYPVINTTNTTPTGSTNIPVDMPVPIVKPPTTKPSIHLSPILGPGDTAYITQRGDTLTTITHKDPHWISYGTSVLLNYRNNRQVLQSYGVDINQAHAPLPPGIPLAIRLHW